LKEKRKKQQVPPAEQVGKAELNGSNEWAHTEDSKETAPKEFPGKVGSEF
jgi:hypothetical protein